jgi:hypothetical protein
MAGKHRARKATRRQVDAYVLLGTGAIAFGLGVALASGSGIAQADTTNTVVSGPRISPSPEKSAATTSIRTTVSAQSVNMSSHSSTPVVAGENATSIVTTKDSVVRQMTPTDTGDNDAGPARPLTETVLGLNNNDQALNSGIPGLDAAPNIPFIELGGGGLLSQIAGALSGGLF